MRTQVDEAPYPDTWPEAIKEVLEKYTPSVLTDELSEERRIHGPDMEIHLRDDASPFMTISSPSISIHQEPIARKMMIDMLTFSGIIVNFIELFNRLTTTHTESIETRRKDVMHEVIQFAACPPVERHKR